MEYNISYRKKDGNWQYIISFKEDGKWKQRTKQGFKTRSLAKIAADVRLDELKDSFEFKSSKEYKEYENLTLDKFLEIFINGKQTNRAHNSIRNYRSAYKHFKELGPLKIEDITFAEIQNCVTIMIQNGLAPSSIHLYVTQIKTIFGSAVEPYKLIKDNPTKGLMIPKVEKDKKIKALTKSELALLLSRIKSEKIYIMCLLASHCGLRLGEIIGLSESDINFKTLEVNIHRQWKLLAEGVHGFGIVKSDSRHVPIPGSIVASLRGFLDTNVKNFDGRIFNDMRNADISTVISNTMKEVGFNNTLHDLRHTYATMLIASGLDFKTVAELLGDTVEVVISTYAHVTDDMMDVAKSRVNQIF